MNVENALINTSASEHTHRILYEIPGRSCNSCPHPFQCVCRLSAVSCSVGLVSIQGSVCNNGRQHAYAWMRSPERRLKIDTEGPLSTFGGQLVGTWWKKNYRVPTLSVSVHVHQNHCCSRILPWDASRASTVSTNGQSGADWGRQLNGTKALILWGKNSVLMRRVWVVTGHSVVKGHNPNMWIYEGRSVPPLLLEPFLPAFLFHWFYPHRVFPLLVNLSPQQVDILRYPINNLQQQR